MSITATSRFNLTAQFTEILTQCHIRRFNFELAPLVGREEGRLCVEINSESWPTLSIGDYLNGIQYYFSDNNHGLYSVLYPWAGLEKAMEEFDHIILHHTTEEEPHPSFEWILIE